MNQADFQREQLAYEEKIALAELEESKAGERVQELKYQRSRFNLDCFLAVQQEQAKQAAEAQKAQKP